MAEKVELGDLVVFGYEDEEDGDVYFGIDVVSEIDDEYDYPIGFEKYGTGCVGFDEVEILEKGFGVN